MKKKLLLTLLLLISASAYADTANISWEAPIAREDDSDLLPSEIGGYRIYLNKTDPIDIPATVSTYTMAIVGEKVLNMTTIDTAGRESAFSPDITLNGKSNPSAPDVTVTITIEINTNTTAGDIR